MTTNTMHKYYIIKKARDKDVADNKAIPVRSFVDLSNSYFQETVSSSKDLIPITHLLKNM